MKDVKSLGLDTVLALLVAGLSGCLATTALMESTDPTRPGFRDTIIAIGLPDAASAQKLGVPHVVAFLGEKNTYVLTKGGETLMQIATELDGNLIDVDRLLNKLYIKDKAVWGSLYLKYSSRSPEENAALNRIGFTPPLGFADPRTTRVYQLKVSVEGELYPAVILSDEQKQKLKKKHRLDFYDLSSSSPSPDSSSPYRLLAPFTIALDVVTFPIQLVACTVFLFHVMGPGEVPLKPVFSPPRK